MGHFDSIGLAVADLPRVVDEAIDAALDPRRVVWRDATGATVSVFVEGSAVACVTPFFVPPSPAAWRVRTTAPLFDAGCTYCGGADCDVLDGDGDMITRATVQWSSFRDSVEWLRGERTFDLAVVAFAHDAWFGESMEAIHDQRRETLGDLRLADEAFLPLGMFGTTGDVTQRATALFTGRVERVTRHVGASGLGFVHARVRSLQGAIDVVLDDRLGGGAVVGRQAMIDGWLVGRPSKDWGS